MSAIATARMAGGGGEAVIFVHGVGSTAAIWDYQLKAFAGEYRCFAVELRGNGVPKPEAAPDEITREGFAADALALADAAGVHAFHLVGCSLGGVVGFELHRRAPQRLKSLTFVDSFAAYPDGERYAASVIESARASGSMEAFALERARKLGMPPGTRTDETIAQMACKTVESYAASTRATWTGDYRADLASIRVPSLVVCGERDAVAPPALSREIAAGIPGAELHVIPGAGHVANADAPEAFNELLRRFLLQTTRSGAA